MNINKAKEGRDNKLQNICEEKDIEYDKIKSLLDAVRKRKLFKRNSYVQQTINDIIENSL